VTIASVTVPAGNYLVSATGWAASVTGGPYDARCYINQPNGNANDTFLNVNGVDGTPDIADQESFAVHLNVASAGGTITVGCIDDAPAGDIQYGAQLTATAVGTLHGTTFLKPHTSGPTSPSAKR
jgi:hypothetical protein